MSAQAAVPFNEMPGAEPACDAVEAAINTLLATGYSGMPAREVAQSLCFSLGLIEVGRAPRRAALIRLVALGLITLARMDVEAEEAAQLQAELQVARLPYRDD